MTGGFSVDMKHLIEAARDARQRAYAPYSSYPVGAALLASSGKVYTGCNIENASYGLTICAERVALGTAVAAGEREFDAIVIAGGEGEPSMPCGACRQFMTEWGKPEMQVVIVSGQGHRRDLTLGDLFPHAFSPASLLEGAGK